MATKQYANLYRSTLDALMEKINSAADSGWELHTILPNMIDGFEHGYYAIMERDR